MSYLVPYYLTLPPKSQGPLLTCLAQDEPGVPNDTYVLDDWYCPTPNCNCQDVVFGVRARHQGHWVAWIRWSLDPARPTAPTLDRPDEAAAYAPALLQALTPVLTGDPTWRERCRVHYRQVKTATANPTHHAYRRLMEWAETGGPTPVAQKRRRQRR